MAMRRIGQILVDLGFISDEQLEQLLEEQPQRPGKKLGKLAEELGYISDDQLTQALAEQWGMQVIHLADIVIPPQVLGYVTEPMAQLYRIIPVSFREGTLTIAVCDPQNITVQDELRTFLGYEIRAVVATERDIANALDRYYSTSSESVESLVADMEADKELARMAEKVNKRRTDRSGQFRGRGRFGPGPQAAQHGALAGDQGSGQRLALRAVRGRIPHPHQGRRRAV